MAKYVFYAAMQKKSLKHKYTEEYFDTMLLNTLKSVDLKCCHHLLSRAIRTPLG